MPRGDGLEKEVRFADRNDEAEDIGYGGGGGGGGSRSNYDDDEDDEGGWATHRESDDLWDSTDDLDDDDSDAEPSEALPDADEDDEDAFGRMPIAKAPKASAAKQ